MSSRSCSQCGNNGHNSRTCAGNGFMLFGVRVAMDGSIRKSVSMNNLSQYEHADHQQQNAEAAATGYTSDDAVHPSAGSREKKRDSWKRRLEGISRNFVKTRTPTQVASHAQKYFQRRNNLNRRRRRSSLFDITTDTFLCFPVEEETNMENGPSPNPVSTSWDISLESLPVSPTQMDGETKNIIAPPGEPLKAKLVKPVPVLASMPLGMAYLDRGLGLSPSPLSAKLSEQHNARHSAFHAMVSFRSGDLDNKGTIITVV